jgi:hypothetical protein
VRTASSPLEDAWDALATDLQSTRNYRSLPPPYNEVSHRLAFKFGVAGAVVRTKRGQEEITRLITDDVYALQVWCDEAKRVCREQIGRCRKTHIDTCVAGWFSALNLFKANYPWVEVERLLINFSADRDGAGQRYVDSFSGD